MFLFQVGNVIQFNERHNWCGCFGTIVEVKTYDDGSTRYMVEVPHLLSDGDGPHVYPAYIFVSDRENAIEYIGRAVFTTRDRNDKNTGPAKTAG